jgi:transposase InsO family protein
VRGELPTYTVRYEIIATLAPNYPITWLTSIAKVHRSGYYKWLNRQDHLNMKDQEDKALKELIVKIHLEYKMYGYPRIKEMLKERGFLINHKKVYRLMCELQIQAIIRKKRRSHTGKPSRIFENLLDRQFQNRVFNEAFVTDITYIPTPDGFRYLSVIQDLYNNEIVAWKLSKRNDVQLVLDTIALLKEKRNVYGCILHSDQGYQYTSHEYIKELAHLGIHGSHSRKGNCHDNACVESFFSHFKSECVYLNIFETDNELNELIENYIYFYNYQRFQKKLSHLAPIEYRCQMAA